MRYAHPNVDCLNIEKHEKDEKKRGMRFAQNRRTDRRMSERRTMLA